MTSELRKAKAVDPPPRAGPAPRPLTGPPSSRDATAPISLDGGGGALVAAPFPARGRLWKLIPSLKVTRRTDRRREGDMCEGEVRGEAREEGARGGGELARKAV